MVTVIQPRQGNAGTDLLSALNVILGTIGQNQKAGQEADLLKAALLKDQGEFVPTPAPPRSFLDVLFGGSSAPDSLHIGNSAYQFQPYQALGEAGARVLGLTRPVTESYAPMQALPLSDTPAGPALPSLPTPSTATTDTVSPAIARLRLSPKTTEALTLEELKDNRRLTELDQRLEAAKQQGDARAEAALTRLRERLAARRDELELKELGTEGRRGTGTSDSADMKVDDALAKLKELRARPYFRGLAAAKLDRLEQLITQTQKQERSHVSPAITAQLKGLELQLDRAERREGVRPPPPTPLRPPPGRQSATGSRTPAGTVNTNDPGPSPEMLATVRKSYEAMTPEEAEVDLKATLQEDPTLRSLVAQARQQAYITLFPDRPLQLQVPPAPPATAATPPAASIPAPSASAPPAVIKSPSPAVAASTAPGQENAARATAPQPPQAQAMTERLKSYYETFTDADLAQEARHLERPERQDTLTPYRQQALTQVREARKTRPQPATPAPPANAMQQKILDHYHGQYQHLSTNELLAEQQRLMDADPLGRDVRTSLQLSAITMLIAQRQAPPRTGSPQEDAEP